jgi:hypothetical protein
MSTTLVTRQTAGTGATVKGSPLTNTEVDTNFINLNNATQPSGGTAGQVLSKIDATNFNSQWIDNYATAVKITVKNSTGTTITKGSVVYVSGATGANVLVGLAKADAESTSSQTLGFVEADIVNGASGLVVYTGTITGLNTSAYTEGDPVFLSGTVAGGIVVGLANKPAAPTHLVYLGVVTRSNISNGEIQVRVSNGWELSEIHDVQIVSKANNDIIQYDSASSLWKNVTATTARTNLGLAIGTNVQAWDADLDAIAALAGTSGLLKKTGANTWTLDTSAYLTSAVTSVTGTSPVVSSGGTTPAISLASGYGDTQNPFASKTANYFMAAPNGAAGAPTFRAIVAADVPTLNQNTTGSSGSCTGNAATATTATTANALNTANNYQVNSLGVGTAASGTAGEIRATNNITAYYSDNRLKTKIGDIENPLEQVRQIKTLIYHANEIAVALGYDSSVIEVGLDAQSVQRVQPHVVAPAPIDPQYLTVRYERLVPLLVEAIKALDTKLDSLTALVKQGNHL